MTFGNKRIAALVAEFLRYRSIDVPGVERPALDHRRAIFRGNGRRLAVIS